MKGPYISPKVTFGPVGAQYEFSSEMPVLMTFLLWPSEMYSTQSL